MALLYSVVYKTPVSPGVVVAAAGYRVAGAGLRWNGLPGRCLATRCPVRRAF
jgi:hypothetical protein